MLAINIVLIVSNPFEKLNGSKEGLSLHCNFSYENKVPCHLMHTNYTNRYENDLLYVISNCYIKMVVNQKQIHVSKIKW